MDSSRSATSIWNMDGQLMDRQPIDIYICIYVYTLMSSIQSSNVQMFFAYGPEPTGINDPAPVPLVGGDLLRFRSNIDVWLEIDGRRHGPSIHNWFPVLG